jgi:hypothetical protein
MAIMDSIKAELDEYKRVVREQVAEISRLRSEVERLTVAADAYTALRAVYIDPSASQSNKVKAAAAAIPYERPKILPVPPVLELSGEEIEPLAVVVERQRARLNLLLGPSTDQASPSNGVGGDDNSD